MLKTGWRRFGITMLVIIVIGLSSAGCGESTSTSLPTPTRFSPLTPYFSPTPSKNVISQTRTRHTSTPPPPPTPTPVTYQVVKGDTMLGIALRYGIPLVDLLAANPEVNPRFLSIDTVLIIPQGEETTEVPTTPTPPPVELDDPVCYATYDGGAWCFLLVQNEGPYGLENISSWIGLYTQDGKNVAGELGITPLNLLPAGGDMPVVVRFSPRLPEDFTAISDRFNAFAVPEDTDRYLGTELAVEEMEISENGLQASLRGMVSLPKESPAAKLVWVLAVAHDREGNVVGVRRWERVGTSSEEELSDVLIGGKSLPFSLEVYSLGPAIERVNVLVEARP